MVNKDFQNVFSSSSSLCSMDLNTHIDLSSRNYFPVTQSVRPRYINGETDGQTEERTTYIYSFYSPNSGNYNVLFLNIHQNGGKIACYRCTLSGLKIRWGSPPSVT